MPVLKFSPDLHSTCAGDLTGFPECRVVFERVPALPCRTVSVNSLLHRGEHSTVFAGVCKDKDCTEVVLKFAPITDLRKEATVYRALEKLQGISVPVFYGLFFARRDEEDETACIILERLGKELDQPFTSLPRSDKAKILTHLKNIHHHGVRPLDFAERNTLRHGDDYRLIDFEHVEEHTCGWDYDFINASDYDENRAEMASSCPDLYIYANDMRFWRRGRVIINSCGVPRGKTLPPQDIIDRLKPSLRRAVPLEHTTLVLMHYFSKVWEQHLNGVSIEDLEAKKQQMIDEAIKWFQKEYPEASRQPVYPSRPPFLARSSEVRAR